MNNYFYMEDLDGDKGKGRFLGKEFESFPRRIEKIDCE
jgi:hypothetical protein